MLFLLDEFQEYIEKTVTKGTILFFSWHKKTACEGALREKWRREQKDVEEKEEEKKNVDCWDNGTFQSVLAGQYTQGAF